MYMRIARRRENAYTLIELLIVMFIAAFATTAYVAVRENYGTGWAKLAAAVAVLVGVGLVVLFYRWTGRQTTRQLAALRERYRTIYRVKELPTDDKSIVKPQWAEIQIGDCGWEARPARRDGLIHLQGLTTRWEVVWHAGFHPEQIEKVAEKPVSQYDYWAPYWAKRPPPPPCPFPVRERNTPTMGLPHHSGRYFKDYPSQYYQSRLEKEPAQPAPVMTAAELAARNRPLGDLSVIWFVLFVATLSGTSLLCFYMDRAKPALWIQILTFCGICSAIVFLFVLHNRMRKLIAKKRGFQCPACGNEITALTGLAGRHRELCNRCGTQVIEFNKA
jgi:hypothetical protein